MESTDKVVKILHADSKLGSNRTGDFLENWIDSNRFITWIESNRELECTSGKLSDHWLKGLGLERNNLEQVIYTHGNQANLAFHPSGKLNK